MSQQYSDENRGVLFLNDRKQSDKHPDFRGKGNYNGVDFEVSAWRKKGRNGTFISLSFKEPYQKPPREERNYEHPDDLGGTRSDPMDDDDWG